LVTGGGDGIGAETCLEFARAGARVVIVDINRKSGEKTLSLVESLGGKALFIEADVSRAVDVERYVNETVSRFGQIDIFFNNAGIVGAISPIQHYPEDEFDRVMAINVKGVFLGLKYVLPVMIAQKSGSIINMSSTSGMKGYPGFAAYSTSKHAVVGLTRVAAGEVIENGVRVNAICPGPVNTQLLEESLGKSKPTSEGLKLLEKLAAINTPLGRFAEVDEVAKVVLFLASENASFLNGVILPIDAGTTAI
jgi:NAD(P)-dependent dehydrogenase (short-subunit alcohol dehydrogenase family)